MWFERISLPRLAQVLGLTLIPSMLILGGCSDDCTSAFDCPSRNVCYIGQCVAALNPNLLCESDIDCGEEQMGRPRPYSCLAGRCQANPSNFVPIDSGIHPDAGDAGTVDATAVDTGVPDTGLPDSGMPNPDASVSTVAMCTFDPNTPTDEDTIAPLVIAATVDNDTPNSGDLVTISLRVAEGGCGLASVKLFASADSMNGMPPDQIQIPNPRDQAIPINPPSMGLYEFSIPVTISDCLTPNAHRISRIQIADNAGNTQEYRYVAGETNYQRSENGGPEQDSGVVVVAMTPATTGIAPPVLSSAAATANAMGFDVAVGATEDVNSCGRTFTTVTAVSTRGHRVVGTADNSQGQPNAAVVVNDCARSGDWGVESIEFNDAAGRSIKFTAVNGTYRRADGTDTGVAVTTIGLMGGAGDAMSPTLEEFVTSGSSAEPGGVAARVDLPISDDVCGFAGSGAIGRISLRHDTSGAVLTGNVQSNADLASGCVPIPACARAGTYSLSRVWIGDIAGSTVTMSLTGGAYDAEESDGMVDSDVPAQPITFDCTRNGATLGCAP